MKALLQTISKQTQQELIRQTFSAHHNNYNLCPTLPTDQQYRHFTVPQVKSGNTRENQKFFCSFYFHLISAALQKLGRAAAFSAPFMNPRHRGNKIKGGFTTCKQQIKNNHQPGHETIAYITLSVFNQSRTPCFCTSAQILFISHLSTKQMKVSLEKQQIHYLFIYKKSNSE